MSATGTITIERWPETDEELWEFVDLVWGVRIPRVAVCPGHVAPFTAFADAYFCRAQVDIWKASRGFGGKSHLLALLAVTEALTLAADVNVLGGSAAQSLNVHEHTGKFWTAPLAPTHMLLGDPTKYDTNLVNGAHIRALMASQRSVRGPHPQRLRLDEIDEMELAILEAAQGQPMDALRQGKMVLSQTVMSSTHQYPDGTMTAMMRRATEKGWSLKLWCYKESMGTKDDPGWLTERQVESKRMEIPVHMWDTEYELQEPAFEGRAIDSAAVDRMFDINKGKFDGRLDEKLYYAKRVPGATYITGVDWAKESDYTIISTYRTDVRPWKMVAFMRTGRKPWPVMIHDVEWRVKQYGGLLVHDSTGVGNVVNDMLTIDRSQVMGIEMRGRTREILFNEYISAIENDEFEAPRIEYAWGEHKFCTTKDLYGPGHPPDTIVSGAMAWQGRNRSLEALMPVSLDRSSSPWRGQ